MHITMLNIIFIVFIFFYYHHEQHLLYSSVDASSLLYTINDLRYSLSDRILTLPQLGSIRGIQINYEDFDRTHHYGLVNVQAYLGLQYGFYHERYERSKEFVDFESKTHVKKLIDFGPACPQYLLTDQNETHSHRWFNDYYSKLYRFIVHQNENNCLTMNIYQPMMTSSSSTSFLPIVLFIHGDDFDTGTGAAFDGAIFASYTKSIVVTVNYRLGALGFLYLSPENNGNYALHDIYTSLHWIKNNIHHFNGDANRVTVYGTGTGAVLASLVVMMETVNGGSGTKKRRKSLIHRLILNDQTFLSPSMTTNLQEIHSCSTTLCPRNRTTVELDELLRLSRTDPSLRPLEDPFPFDQSSSNSLRNKFSRQPSRLLPEHLAILLTTSPSDRSFLSSFNPKISPRNHLIEHLIHYAYTRWNSTSNQFEFDSHLLYYHQEIIAPLLDYAKVLSPHRTVHIVERSTTKYLSELPLTFGYVLAPSMSVFNETYLHADQIDRDESLLLMDLFANLIHQGDINDPSPYCHRCQHKERWRTIYPELNFILLKNGTLSQTHGYYAQVHYLFNNLISTLYHQSDLFHTWKTLYHVSTPMNNSKSSASSSSSLRYSFLVILTFVLVFLFNVILCLVFYGHRTCRKRHYNCLNHPASPSSTNTDVDIFHPRNVRKHDGIFHQEHLPEAIV